MKKIRMNCTATLDETFADFLLSRRAKGLVEKTLESYSSQWKACFSTPNLFILFVLFIFISLSFDVSLFTACGASKAFAVRSYYYVNSAQAQFSNRPSAGLYCSSYPQKCHYAD